MWHEQIHMAAGISDQTLVKVCAAIVGGGLNLSEGEIVPLARLGDHAEQLIRQGAVELLPVPEALKARLL